VVKATARELKLFRTREDRLYMRHKIVEICLARAVALGEQVLRARRMQLEFETRPCPRPLYSILPVANQRIAGGSVLRGQEHKVALMTVPSLGKTYVTGMGGNDDDDDDDESG
jgi:hypothetical protein